MYNRSSTMPSYIKSLVSHKRKGYFDNFIEMRKKVTSRQEMYFNLDVSENEPVTYDAWKEDIAVVNFFFGQNTVIGECLLK